MAFENGQIFNTYDCEGVFRNAIILPTIISNKMEAIYLIRRHLTKLEMEYMENEPDVKQIEEMTNGIFDVATELYFRG